MQGARLTSSVVLTLPRIEPARAAGDVASNALAERYRVLIIENDTAARDALRQQMEMWGNEVRLASSAETGLAETHAFHPHIVLCDLGMPGLERFDRHQLPRSEPNGRRVFVAAVTGAGGVEDEARTLAAGYDSVLVRPLEAESLAKLLRLYAKLPSAVQ